MASISSCVKADEADIVGQLTPVIGVGDEGDTAAKLIEWPRMKGSRVEYPTGCSQFREFYKAKSSINWIWGHAFAYRGNFFRTCSVSQGGDYLMPDLAQEKKCRHLGDEVSLEYAQGIVKDSQTDGFCCYLAQFNYGLTIPLSNLAKSVMNWIGACPAQLNCNFWEVILVCKTLNGRWAASGSERRITAKDFLEYYAVKYVTATNGAYLLSSSSRPYFFDLSSAGRVRNDNLLWVSGECLQRSDEEPLELNNRTITKGINYKVLRKESFIDVVSREGTELEAVLNELEITRFKRVASKDDKLEENLIRERVAFQLEREKEREVATLKLKEVRAESEAEAERLVTALAISWNNLAGKLYQLRYSKAEIMAFSDGNYEEMEIMDEEEIEEREDGLNVAENTAVNNQETINQYEDRLDDNVKLSLMLEEAKRQVEQKTATILSRDLALFQLTSELAELKEKATPGSRHEAELAEYRIRALNEEISDMKCNICTLNELDHVKADLRRLKGKEAQSRADLAEIQAKNKILVDDLAHARGKSIDLTRQMSERIDQLAAELAESKARHLKDNKRAAVTHQAFKEIAVHEQEKCDGEALHIGCIFCQGN
ncbi:hypothetical protein GIB67_017831 [Kingdonia uniflora]|uniref:Uncharacterized protein n=1 Tax=Kingdonia uniflora TaxID=39325 RepID=A0A7J7MP23_9MAGN|nr:hypothetical protein GIB67_017831 [Kingdonia uniflora]